MRKNVRIVNLGEKIGRLEIIEDLGILEDKARWVMVKCDCGTIKKIRFGNLNNHTTSCGCYQREQANKPRGKAKPHKGNRENHSAYLRVWDSQRRGARQRGYQFDLSLDDSVEYGQQNCHYCGGKPSNFSKHKYQEIWYNGIDRINNDKGYVEGNMVTCCKWCNSAKNNRSLKEFQEWINRLIKYQTEKL